MAETGRPVEADEAGMAVPEGRGVGERGLRPISPEKVKIVKSQYDWNSLLENLNIHRIPILKNLFLFSS